MIIERVEKKKRNSVCFYDTLKHESHIQWIVAIKIRLTGFFTETRKVSGKRKVSFLLLDTSLGIRKMGHSFLRFYDFQTERRIVTWDLRAPRVHDP